MAMSNAGFDTARWDHWLLLASFAGIALIGLRLSWQWRKQRLAKFRLRRRLSSQRDCYGKFGDAAFGDDILGDAEPSCRKPADLTSAEVRSDMAQQRSDALSVRRLPRYVRAKRRPFPKRIR